MKKKKISILIPCYNEEDNVKEICIALTAQLKQLTNYSYEILFIDNLSKDKTRVIIKEICKKDKKVKAIFNAANFGQFNSPYYGMCQLYGDCVILICCDFQDPIELIPEFIKYWEEGYQVVCGVKTSSKENKIIYWMRTIYYKLIKKFSSVEQIEHFTGFGLYDKSFIDILRKLNDPTPFLRGIVAEYATNKKIIEYEQQKRKAGKTHNNFYTLYDAAMLSFTSYTKIGMRLSIFVGCAFALFSMIFAIAYLILKLIYWNRFIAGQAPTIIIISLMCSIIMLFLGVLGEYVLSINTRVINRPLVIEKERINFNNEKNNKQNI